MGNFFGELKRRKVLRVAAAYIVSSWVLLQVADLLTDILELPGWAPKLVLLMLVVGFVPALILSWAYDVTPDGVLSESGDTASKAPVAVAMLLVLAGLAVGGWWYAGKDVRWLHETAIPGIEAHLDNGEIQAAFSLARQVETVLPGLEEMQEIWTSFAWQTSIPSVPSGADVYWRPYANPDAEWQHLGTTPIYDTYVPMGLSVLRIEAEGYKPLLRVIGGGLPSSILPVLEEQWLDFNISPENYVLDTPDSLPEGMVRVPGWSAVQDGASIKYRDFFLSRHEVTNSQFLEFVEGNGYGRSDLWEYEFVDGDQTLTFEESMSLFVDRTGRPGPGTWTAGTYPDGKAEHPVSGISWYEAAAYARLKGLELPTIHHWRHAMAIGALAWELPLSNIGSDGTVAVGTTFGIGWTGTFEMAGNVREWCANAVQDDQRVIVGGAWDDLAYFVGESVSTPHRRPAFDRAEGNGFRLMASRDEANVKQAATAPVVDAEIPEMPSPSSDEVFAAKLRDFDYDQRPLNAVVEESVEFRYWTRQRVSFDAPNGENRIILYLYLPYRESSRYKTILYWPDAMAQEVDSIDVYGFELAFAIRGGRAVAFPVLDGMFKRRESTLPDWQSHNGRDMAIEEVREFRRMIDYLETRVDVDTDKLAYYGRSWGGRVGAIMMAVEPRIKVGVLNQAGINAADHADINVVHFLPRVTAPVLQFNGRYDTDFRFESSAKPFFDRLGTPDSDKRHVVEPTGHFVSPDVMSGEMLDWLDKYQGPVE